MNGPPLPTTPTAMPSYRLEQNLTYLAPSVPKCQRSGSALSPPRGSKGNQATASDNYGRFEVKNVRTTFCTPVFSKPFTLVRCNCPKEQPIENSDSRVTVKNH